MIDPSGLRHAVRSVTARSFRMEKMCECRSPQGLTLPLTKSSQRSVKLAPDRWSPAMHRPSLPHLGHWPHNHDFLGPRHDENERRTWAVVALTAAMMVAEIAGGVLFGSMALIADGWHMATHAGALAVAALAYRLARRHADNEHFGFGTGKVGDLAAYSSALVLAVVAVLIGYELVQRLVSPVAIGFDQAIAIAVAGLAVNLASAWLLREGR